MKSLKLLCLLTSILISAGCGSILSERTSTRPASELPKAKDTAASEQETSVGTQQVSLNQADQSQSMAEAMNRKIIRNADLSLEVPDPSAAQRKITSIAESLGGFVVTTESKQRQNGDTGKQELEVNVVVRVPAAQFGPALDQIRAEGSRVIQEKTTGQDVTEDFIDLEARIKTQRALELQFLEIMKQANKVADALEVQRQIAEVRTGIEKLEGRKRFLENRASLSTITIVLQSPGAIIVSTSSFRRSLREAVAESFEVATQILLFAVRFVIVMIPIVLLVILPGGLLARFIFRRAKIWQPARGTQPSSESESD